jgi:hypothetical protein
MDVTREHRDDHVGIVTPRAFLEERAPAFTGS